MSRAVRINAAILALVFAGALGGCGRAGPLEPPPDAQAVAKQSANPSADPSLPQPHPRPKPIQAPHQSFLLDPLL